MISFSNFLLFSDVCYAFTRFLCLHSFSNVVFKVCLELSCVLLVTCVFLEKNVFSCVCLIVCLMVNCSMRIHVLLNKLFVFFFKFAFIENARFVRASSGLLKQSSRQCFVSYSSPPRSLVSSQVHFSQVSF